jgi:hypothetical protein
MHNPLQLIYQRVYFNIPSEILQLAFQHVLGSKYYSLDQAIHEEIIINRLLPEMNLFAGNTKYVFLEEGYRLTTRAPQPGYNVYMSDIMSKVIYKIPPDVREYKSIVNVVRIGTPQMFGLWAGGLISVNNCNNIATLQNLACNVLNSKTGKEVPMPMVKLIGADMVELSFMAYPYQTVYNYIVEVRLEYDVNLMNVNNQSIIPLAELVECALKCYIYTKLIVKLDKGFVEAGYELGSIKQIIDEYKEAFTEYKDKLMQFIGGSTMTHERMLNMMRMIL